MTFSEYLSFLESDNFKKALHAALSNTKKVFMVPRKNNISTNCIMLTKLPVFDGEWFEMYFEIFIFDNKIEVYKSNGLYYNDYDDEKPKVPVFTIPAKDLELFVDNLENINEYVKNAINKYNQELVQRYIMYRRNTNKFMKQFKHFSQKRKQISETVLDQ